MTCEKDVGMGLCTFNFVFRLSLHPCLLTFWHFIPTSLEIFLNLLLLTFIYAVTLVTKQHTLYQKF